MTAATEIPAGLCQCGCGERTNLAPCNHATKGWVKGRPLRYVAGHQHRPGNRYRAPHGTNGKYGAGCRCKKCTAAHREYRRFQQAAIDKRTQDGDEARGLLSCMLGFGVDEARIATVLGIKCGRVRLRGRRVWARTANELRRLHWGAWHASGDFRRHCDCAKVETETMQVGA